MSEAMKTLHDLLVRGETEAARQALAACNLGAVTDEEHCLDLAAEICDTALERSRDSRGVPTGADHRPHRVPREVQSLLRPVRFPRGGSRPRVRDLQRNLIVV